MHLRLESSTYLRHSQLEWTHASRPTRCYRSGTLLPDGTRWGAFAGATISDASGELFASSEVEVLVSGLRWSEGPVWHAAERALFFVDTVDARVYRWSASDGTTIVGSAAGGFDGSNVPEYETLYEPGANGMPLTSEDEIIICQHSTLDTARHQDEARRVAAAGRAPPL